MSRADHQFQFTAGAIAAAAKAEAEYHEARTAFWQLEYDTAVGQVERTIGAKLVKHQITGGYAVQVVVHHGDPEAWVRTQEAFSKIQQHTDAAHRYRTEQRVYESQEHTGTSNNVPRLYELSADDVHYFRLGGESRDD